jgi:NADH-quinone oxidoreductase subunit J
MAIFLFSYFAGVIVITGIMVVGLRKPMYSALSLLVLFFHVAGIYLLLDAEFIFAVQVIAYAGAILVLYLFVVMLLDVKAEEGYHRQLVMGLLLGFAIIGEMTYILSRSTFGEGFTATIKAIENPPGTTESIGHLLFTRYLFPFEVASIILLVAMIGAIFLAKEKMFEKES